jgi:hypothetical protein
MKLQTGKLLLWVLIVISFFFQKTACAMDGVSVTVIRNTDTEEIVAYTVKNNTVTGQKSLYKFLQTSDEKNHLNSPSINPGGTHVVFYRGWSKRNVANNAVQSNLAIVSIETGIWKDICTIDPLSGYLPVAWWLLDGSIIVWDGKCTMKKFVMKKSGTSTVVTESLFAKFDYYPQHQYVDLSMDGKIISYRIYDPPCVSTTKRSAQIIGPVPADPSTLLGPDLPGFKNACGCGNAVSPLGDRNGCWGGSGHEVTVYRNTNETTNANLLLVNNMTDIRSWCNCGLPNLPFGGTDFGHGWSVNSKKWTVLSLGCDGRFAKGGAGQFLLNIDEKKTIDVTGICTDQKSAIAYRGDLWVSTQADVDESLYHYVQNRDQHKAALDDLMAGLPDKAHTPTGIAELRQADRRKQITICQAAGGGLVIGSGTITGTHVELYDISSKLIRKILLPGNRTVTVNKLPMGFYSLRITSGATTTFHKAAIVN